MIDNIVKKGLVYLLLQSDRIQANVSYPPTPKAVRGKFGKTDYAKLFLYGIGKREQVLKIENNEVFIDREKLEDHIANLDPIDRLEIMAVYNEKRREYQPRQSKEC